MKSLSTSGFLFSFVLLILTFPGLMAQNNNADNFVPEVGQQGKDVVWVPTPQELVDKGCFFVSTMIQAETSGKSEA